MLILGSVQSRVMPAWTSDEEEAEGEVSDGATRLLFAEWDADADANHKANLVKYGNAIFCETQVRCVGCFYSRTL